MVNQSDVLTKREAELVAKSISKMCKEFVFVVLMKNRYDVCTSSEYDTMKFSGATIKQRFLHGYVE